MTSEGPRQVADLVGTPFEALVDGHAHATESQGFFATGVKPVLKLRTREGHELRLSADHPVRRVWHATRNRAETEWVKAGELAAGDRIALNDHRALVRWEGEYGQAEGYLLGLLLGDGHLKMDEAVLGAWDASERREANGGAVISPGVASMMQAAREAASRCRIARISGAGTGFPGSRGTTA